MATMMTTKPVPHPEEEDECYSCSEGDADVMQCEEKYVSDGESLTFPGPLMRAKIQKDKLMTFIHQKCQECLLHLDDPQQQISYVFWTIMERFHKKNGRVMMAEISALLYKGYGLLSQKLRRVENQGSWCLSLARLLCSTAAGDQHREAIINMGDKFGFLRHHWLIGGLHERAGVPNKVDANRGWTYAAHICYVVAQVDLGSQPKFNLVGCTSLPKEKSAMTEAMERTEVYEYLLSLGSGFGQAHFQEFKCIHACKLAEDGLDALALDYYEIIATTILRFPERIQSTVLELLISLSEKLLQRKEAEEPEWLMKLRQLLEDNAEPCSASDEQNGSSSKCEKQALNPSVRSELYSRYTVEKLLGKGGYSSVYAGVRKADERPVAIKVSARYPDDVFINIPGETLKLPLEVALIKMTTKPPRCENVVELLEWFQTSKKYILVLERPVPCMDLYYFRERNNQRLSEPVVREVMWQVVQAVDHCHKCGIFHRDIKLENILINPDTLAVKLIDFGCGGLKINEPYRDFSGTQGYYSPEWVLCGQYYGVPGAVWSLGVVLYELVFGKLPFKSNMEVANAQLSFHCHVSDECCDLIRRCLTRKPKSRPGFSEILSHKWFEKKIQNPVQTPPAD